jgi:hypothetical protein
VAVPTTTGSSTLTPSQIYGVWTAAGGDPSAGRVAVAVALAESGGDPNAISPTADYGLWQIHLPFHLGDGGISWTNWMDPVANARAAIAISSNGANWGPWCTAWANPNDCATGALSAPQPGSPAYAQLANVTIDTSGSTAGVGNVQPSVPSGWDGFRYVIQHDVPATWERFLSAADAASTIG